MAEMETAADSALVGQSEERKRRIWEAVALTRQAERDTLEKVLGRSEKDLGLMTQSRNELQASGDMLIKQYKDLYKKDHGFWGNLKKYALVGLAGFVGYTLGTLK